MARVLFVFAHQDDEIAAASRIRFVRARGDHVACVYLTECEPEAVRAGDFVEVEIVGANGYDLIGRPVV